jgi:hypothetical protein
MGKSLAETAKAILMNESNDSAPDRDAKKSNPNMATLRPGSKSPEGKFANPNSNAPDAGAQDLGSAPVKPGEGENFGAKAAVAQKKDKTIKGSEKSGEKSAKAEMMEEDIEIDEDVATIEEQIDSYIEQLVAEGHDEETIAEAVEQHFGEYLEEDAEAEAEAEASYQVDMSEHIEALLAGEGLSEEFRTKAVTIFEAAVMQKVQEEIELLEAAYAETLGEQIEAIQEELSSNVDDYLNYVVEQWVGENEIAIDAGLRSELTEDFISGLRNLFAEHYIDIPEDKVNVVEEMGYAVSELEEKLNEEIERNVHLTKVLNESKQYEILIDACEGLTSTQAEKLKALSEGIEFNSSSEYAQKINILRESYFNANVNSSNVLDATETVSDGKGMISEELQGPMASYVRTLGKKLPN